MTSRAVAAKQLMKALAAPLLERFKVRSITESIVACHSHAQYHFCTPRKTNQVEKPEWCLQFVLASIRDRETFINNM